MKLDYDEMLVCQTIWRENASIPQERVRGLITLSNTLMQRAKENGDKLEAVTLLYPEDCADYDAFKDFAFVMSAYIHKKGENSWQMDGWFLNREVDVE